MNKEQKMTDFIRYIRREKQHVFGDQVQTQRVPIGCMVARNINGKVCIGWSLCHKKDAFKKDRARQIAAARTETCHATIPDKILGDLTFMANKAMKVFKTEQVFIMGKPMEHWVEGENCDLA